MEPSWVVTHLALNDDRVVMQSGMSRAQLLCRNACSAIDSFRADVAVLTDYSNLIPVSELCAH